MYKLKLGKNKEVLRHGELSNELSNVTDTVLAASLKLLIKNEIVNQSYDEIPPKVECSIKYCQLFLFYRWADTYHKKDTENTLMQYQKCDYSKK